jgi:ubiquinone/menaquinone biosynthesis C-methylase UbiE
MLNKEELASYFNKSAKKRDRWKRRNKLYHKTLSKYYSFVIPENSRVLEIGSGTGDLLNAVKPGIGVGIDFAKNMVEIAQRKYPHLKFYCADAEEFKLGNKFDYIILSDILSSSLDIQKLLNNLRHVLYKRTKLIISNYNYLWEPVLRFVEFICLKQKQPVQNWLSYNDINNLLELEGYEAVKVERKLLLPKYIPLLHFMLNKFIANLPVINHLNLICFITAKPRIEEYKEYSVSIVIPAKNEKGNIENAITRTPKFGKLQQFIFVEGNSKDGTYEEMMRIKKKYSDNDITVIKQSGKGKGNAVREGFNKATGDILMILDADLTTPPEDMPKFYEALAKNRGEFINGCRLVYPMEKQAMRFLNLVGNKFFGWYFSYLLGQRLKDTLCGTKVLFREDYLKIKQNRNYFGDFDPFGDFDLLFGAAKLNLKITEVLIRYREREYGSTQIKRFQHGWLLIKMSFVAAKKLKFR